MKKILLALAAFLTGVSCGAPKAGYETLGNAEFAVVIAREGVQLIDVRTSGEFAGGHIPGAVNIDVNGADFGVQTATLDKTRPVAVYCRSGVRSRTAAGKLSAQGFEVYNLEDGIRGWDGSVTR